MQLSDIQIFDDSKLHVFLNWKLLMLNKFCYNVDHFTKTIDEDRESFKITYIISRLSKKANTQTLWRRQYKLYRLTTKLLNHLTDLYKILSKIIKDICRQKFNKIEQVLKQSFDEFYRAFMKYSTFRKNENVLLNEMKKKVNSTLRKIFFLLLENFSSLSTMTK